MYFEYNKNGCIVVKDFFEGRIKNVEREVDDVRRMMASATDPQVRLAYLRYISGLEKRLVDYRLRVEEVDGNLKALADR